MRRQAIAAGAIGASLAAHCAPAGEMALTRGAPVIWLGALAVVTLLGGRRTWRPRGFAGSLALAAGAQVAAHLAMSAAPWAFGLAVHHGGGALISPAGVAWHAGAALLLAVLVTRFEALCSRAMALVVRLRRLLRARPRRTAPARGLGAADVPLPFPLVRGRLTCRGPPAPRPA